MEVTSIKKLCKQTAAHNRGIMLLCNLLGTERILENYVIIENQLFKDRLHRFF